MCSFVVSGETTSEELQQRLERAKDQLASQPGSDSAASDGGSVACTAAGGLFTVSMCSSLDNKCAKNSLLRG